MKHTLKLLIFICLCLHSSVYAQHEMTKDEILIISSYNYESRYAFNHITSFVNAYLRLNGKYSPVVESLACQALDDRYRWKNAMNTILDKHPNAKFIILLGPEAWACYLSMTDEKYRKIPIGCLMGQRYGATFTGDEIPCLQVEDDDYKGVVDFRKMMNRFNVKFLRYYEYDIDSDYRLIRHLFPKIRNIAVISDNTYLGLSEMRIVKKTLENNYPDMTPIYIDGSQMSLEEALQAMKNLPENTAAILCIWRFDKKNVIYMNNSEYLFKKANSKVPVFSLTGTGIGYWSIGGSIPQYYENIGESLAEYIYQFLDKAEKNIPKNALCFPNEYRFDMQKVKEFGLSEEMLPEESKYVNDTTEWERAFETYKWYLLLIFLVIILLTIGFIVSIRYSWHIRLLKNNLIEDKKRLQQSEHELRLAKEKAEEGNRLKSAFISNMSHEIRTPLNSIVGFATILEEETRGNENLKEYVNIISYNSDLLLKLINDILDLSRLESGRQNFNFQILDLVPHCANIVAGFQTNIAKGIKLGFKHSTPTIIAETDTTRLQQVLINLIGNAVKFTQKGSIILEVKPNNVSQEWIFSVTDTGCGIPPEKQKVVFERFNKLDEYAQGTGLGLSICQITIENLGGRIWIDPEYTKGARFMFTLPYKHETTDINKP